jgi:hypothetical protein
MFNKQIFIFALLQSKANHFIFIFAVFQKKTKKLYDTE